MSVEKIKKLRDATSLGIADCKKALAESGGDFDQAFQILKKKGRDLIAKKSSRTASQGLVASYVHFGGNLGSLIEVNCETDFVAKTEVFKQFVKDIAMHVAAANPFYVKKDDIPEGELSSCENPEEFIEEHCLLNQAFVKDNNKTIQQYLSEVVSQTGENVVIRRFTRFSLGENEG